MVKNLPASAGDTGDVSLIPGSGRSPGVGNEEPGGLQSMGVAKVGHWETEHMHYCNINLGRPSVWLAPVLLDRFGCPQQIEWRRQWHPTPVLLPGKSHGRSSLVGCSPWGRWVGHDWPTSLSLFTFMHWRRKWQPTPVFLPGESQGRGSLVGCRPRGCTESDTTEAT